MKTSNLDFSISESDLKYLKSETLVFMSLLKEAIKSNKIKAVPFIGGSFAKSTMIQSDNYDVDVFIRFDKKYEYQLSNLLDTIIKQLCKTNKLKCTKLHGSRDYIQISKSKKLTFEIIPVINISNPKQAANTTDLSYFHVNYVRNNLNKNKKLIKEISLAKRFFKAQKVYGAESYISGFSGYAIECLIIYYKTFDRMIKAFLKNDKILIDPKGEYKKQNLLIEMNESKTFSPIVLVDPTWKERNVLAALSQETFEKLKVAIKNYLAHPSESYFEIKHIDEQDFVKKAKQSKSEYLKMVIFTDRQPGDIAGTKLRKFSKFLIAQLSRNFDIIKEEFDYQLTTDATLYLVLKNKKQMVRQGPPISMKNAVLAFKKANKSTFIKAGHICTKLPQVKSKDFIVAFKNKYSDQIKSMDITGITIY